MTDDEFRLVFYENKDAVYNFALRLTGSSHSAEDLCQDCFLELLRKPSGFDPERGSMRAFLLGVTRHLAHKWWREQRSTEPLDADPVLVPDLIAGGASRLIDIAIQSLSPLQREVILLFEYEGFTLEEVSGIVDADVPTVKSRLHRARDRLRHLLAPLRNGSAGTMKGGKGWTR